MRKLWLINLVLLAMLGLAIAEIRNRWEDAARRERAAMNRTYAPPAPPVLMIPQRAPAVTGAQYLEVASELLLSKDRNPSVVVEVVAPKLPPPFPKFYGVMDFGTGPRIVLAEKAGAPQRSYRLGDRIGEFKLSSITPASIDFEWEGKHLIAKIADLKDTEVREAARTTNTAVEAPRPAAAAPTVIGSTATNRPGVEIGQATKGCQPGDTSPAGSVVDGYRKVVTATPFGSACRWERVN